MKINNILYRALLSLTACMLIGVMSGCREENASTIGVVRTVRLSVNVADNGDGQTRATMTETDGTLTSSWETGDKLLVTDASGKNLGVLTLKSTAPAPGSENDQADSSESNPTVRFEGDITTSDTGTVTYNFFHIPSGHVSSGSLSGLSAVKESLVLDYSRQEGTMEWIRSHDIFSGQAQVMFTTAEEGEGGSEETAQSETVVLSRPISFAHFTLTFPEGISASSDTEVKISGSGIYTTLNVSLGEHSYSVGTALGGGSGSAPGSGSGTGVITTRGVDIYLAILIPDGAEQIAPLFTAIINGEEYTGQLSARQWEAGTFVREGHGKGVSVTMEGESDEEDPDNPLTKFAKTNLIRTSPRGSSDITNGFADSETDPGALFQWGRNYGFMPVTTETLSDAPVPENFKSAVGSPYSHWLDAFGPLAQGATGTEYLVVREYDANFSQQYWIYSGGGYGNGSNTIKVRVSDIIVGYQSVTEYSNTAFLMKDFNYQDKVGTSEMWDYWSFTGIGDKWTDRSSVMYADKENPCPKGWHIPTEEDFESILPTTTPTDGESFDELLSGIQTELKESNGKYYAFRWIKHTDGVEIQSVKVTQATDLNSINWNSTKGIVKRVFPFTGRIECLNFNNINGMRYSLPFYPHTEHPEVDDDILDINQTKNIGESLGGYWIDQGNRTFMFSTEQGPGGETNIKGLSASNALASFKICDNQRPWAYAIRPVKDQ